MFQKIVKDPAGSRRETRCSAELTCRTTSSPQSSSIFPEPERMRHISSVSTDSYAASPAISCRSFCFFPFLQLFLMPISGTHFAYKHLFRYSEEHASTKTGWRSFKMFCLTIHIPLVMTRDCPKLKLLCYWVKQGKDKRVWLLSLLQRSNACNLGLTGHPQALLFWVHRWSCRKQTFS